MEKKLCTFIIPVYNTAFYLDRCLRSCVHPNVEIIAIDDGSTDHSLKILEKWQQKDLSIRVLSASHRGAAHARRLGLSKVRTKYFGFVDSDDVIRVEEFLKLVQKLEEEHIKIGNGRMVVYLPGIPIPFYSRKWHKEKIDFTKDKLEFSNTTCSLLDKIYHYDTLELFDQISYQTVYEDMEFIYYVLAKHQKMLHTNHPIYEYHMRSLQNHSTSAIDLNPVSSNNVRGLLSASDSMIQRFQNAGLYEEYKEELESIILKLYFQRIQNTFCCPKIQNKKEMVFHFINILNSYLPYWQQNPYYQRHFPECEYNDYLFYFMSELWIFFHHIDKNHYTNETTEELLLQYDRKLKKTL